MGFTCVPGLRKTHGQHIRSIVNAVRQRASYIFNLNQKYFDTTYDRTTVPELVAMSSFPGIKNTMAPVLFKNFKYDPTMKNFLRNSVLIQVSSPV